MNLHRTDACSRTGSHLRAGLSYAVFLSILGVAPAALATSGQNGLHDPSRMIPSHGKVYVYSTEGGSIQSSDGMVWSSSPRPPWNGSLLSSNDGVWAPDGIYLNGKFFIFYAYWRDSDKSSLVALLTNPTLDSTSPDYKWTDQGTVVAGPTGVTHSVIDPCPVLDAQGNLWVTWGGGYPFNAAAESIWVTRLDNTTGLPLTTDPGWKPPSQPGYPIEPGHKEGSYLYYHDGYYYLFWQTGNAFDPNVGYTINLARASSITGPYSGDRIFYAKNPGPGIYGPGHMGIYSCNGVSRFTYHFYTNETNSGSSLGENDLTWGSDGWPVAGAVSTTPFMPCNPESGAQSNPNVDGGTGGGIGGTGGGSSGGSDMDAGSPSGGMSGSSDDSGPAGGGDDASGGGGGSGDQGSTGSPSSGVDMSSGSASGSVASGSMQSGDTSNSGGGGTASGGNGSPSGANTAASGAGTSEGAKSNSGGGCTFTVAGARGAGGVVTLAVLLGAAVVTRRRRTS